MQIPVLIEPTKEMGFLAHSCSPLELSAEGETQQEALANLKEKFLAKMGDGAVVVPLELPAKPHPLAEFVGIFKDDPWIEDWKKSMKLHRQERDQDADKP